MDTTNVPASTSSAVPAPKAPTSTPPTAGPISRMAPGRMTSCRALADTRSSSGTSIGMRALTDGPKNASPAP